jgi:uncharacterized protein with HEPN domain
MQIEARKLLEDIRQATELITGFVEGKSMAEYRSDALLRSGVERQFQIIGEALSRLARVAPSVSGRLTYASRVIAFRNILVHGYDIVEDETVWDIVQTHLPALRRDVDAMLGAEDP